MATSSTASAVLLRPSPRVPATLSERRPSHTVAGRRRRRGAAGVVRACFNPLGDERILREAIKEPVAFMGGVFAGLLRLDLNEDPLKEWITRTVDASGIAEENSSEESSEADQNNAPQQIEIEANQTVGRCFPTNPMMGADQAGMAIRISFACKSPAPTCEASCYGITMVGTLEPGAVIVDLISSH